MTIPLTISDGTEIFVDDQYTYWLMDAEGNFGSRSDSPGRPARISESGRACNTCRSERSKGHFHRLPVFIGDVSI
jgi:hypothetical protein